MHLVSLMKQLLFDQSIFAFQKDNLDTYHIVDNVDIMLLTPESCIQFNHNLPIEYRIFDAYESYAIPNFFREYTCFINNITDIKSKVDVIPYSYKRVVKTSKVYALHPKSKVKLIHEIVKDKDKWYISIPSETHENDNLIKDEIARIFNLFISTDSN